MPEIQIVLGLLLAIVVLTTIARRLRIPFPVLLVLGGLLLGFIPGLPIIALRPDLVFLLFLPPVLYWESLNLSYRDLRYSIRPILSLAIGLVLATIGVIALASHLVIGLAWPVAFVLGAIIAPTDETAAEAIAEQSGLPYRVLTVVEDESLLNDAVSLVLYNVAVAAVVTGTFSLPAGGLQLVVAAVGGLAVGLIVGWIVAQIRSHLDDPPVENTISLLTGFAAYLPANALHFSGVLAVVAAGIYLARRASRVLTPRTRLQNQEMWEIVNFLLNSLLFVLVGLQLHAILSRLAAYPIDTLIEYAVLVSLIVIVLRIVWVFLATYLPRTLFPRWAQTRPAARKRESWIVAWTGMRGAVSLAAALALPFTIGNGTSFPSRDLIIFLTYIVILATLVVQGLTMPLMITRLGVTPDERESREEVAARLAAAQAGLQRLRSVATADIPPGLIENLRERLEASGRWYGAQLTTPGDPARQRHAARYRQIQHAVLDAEREAVIELRDQGTISDAVLRSVQRDLDLEEAALDA